ncbi:unnamed protein product [Ascophyllum nodosum]
MPSKSRGSVQRSPIFSLEDQLAFYGSYHTNKFNRAIQVACIWPILWTTLALMTQLPIGKLPREVLGWLPLREQAWDLDLGVPIVLIYVIVYCVMDPFVGRLASLLVIASYVTSNLWMAYGGSAALAGGLNMVGWLALFYGNFVLEGRSPAMVNNLFRALLAAPVFVLCGVLFAFGYKPELRRRIKARAGLKNKRFKVADKLKKKIKRK